MNIVKNNIVITINVDGIRTEVLNLICPYDIQIVDNESGNFLGFDELSIMADAFTVLQVIDTLYRRYGNDIEIHIKEIQNKLRMNVLQLMSYIATHFDIFPKNNKGRLHLLTHEQCCHIVEDLKDYHIYLAVNNELSFPLYENEKIYYGKTCELMTVLMILYHYKSVDVKRLTLLYTLLDINIKGENSSNIYYLIKKLEKEIVKFHKKNQHIENYIYADAVTFFQLKHEVYHIKLKKQPNLLNNIIESIKAMSVVYNANNIGNGYRQQRVRDGIMEIFQSEHKQQELACDWYSIIDTINFMISSNYSVQNIKDAIKQILRILVMTQYVKHMSRISNFSIFKIKQAVNNQTFDTLRVANIINAILHSELTNICDTSIIESFVSEIQKYGKDTLGTTIKLGLFDLGILATASSELSGLNKKHEIIPELLDYYSQLCDILRSIILLRTSDTNK